MRVLAPLRSSRLQDLKVEWPADPLKPPGTKETSAARRMVLMPSEAGQAFFYDARGRSGQDYYVERRPLSLPSRSFGVVPIAKVVAKARGLLTFDADV